MNRRLRNNRSARQRSQRVAVGMGGHSNCIVQSNVPRTDGAAMKLHRNRLARLPWGNGGMKHQEALNHPALVSVLCTGDLES